MTLPHTTVPPPPPSACSSRTCTAVSHPDSCWHHTTRLPQSAWADTHSTAPPLTNLLDSSHSGSSHSLPTADCAGTFLGSYFIMLFIMIFSFLVASVSSTNTTGIGQSPSPSPTSSLIINRLGQQPTSSTDGGIFVLYNPGNATSGIAPTGAPTATQGTIFTLNATLTTASDVTLADIKPHHQSLRCRRRRASLVHGELEVAAPLRPPLRANELRLEHE